jgi:hypothetical protein
MQFLKRRFAAAPEGTAALFFIQIFATLGFAVLYSTLVLYATKHLQLSVKAATTLMGVFGAFNYGLHLFGGLPRAALPFEPQSVRRGHGAARSSAAPASRPGRWRCSTLASRSSSPAAASTSPAST